MGLSVDEHSVFAHYGAVAVTQVRWTLPVVFGRWPMDFARALLQVGLREDIPTPLPCRQASARVVVS
jgi:hypothetical protein